MRAPLLIVLIVALTAQAPQTPAAFFLAARTAWLAKPLPPYITYTLAGTFVFGHRTRTFVETVLYRTRDRAAFERRSIDNASPELRFGEASFSPEITFGVAPRTAEHAALVNPDTSSGELPTIGRVAVTTLPYTVTDAGNETVEGTACRHLHLEPQGDPIAHSLREVCIDPATLDVLQVDAVTRVQKGPFTKTIPFEATYHEAGPFWMLDRFHVTGRVHVFFATLSGAGTITVTKIAYPSSIPDYYFTRAAYDAHAADRAKDGLDTP